MSLPQNLANLRRSSAAAVAMLDCLSAAGATPTHLRGISEFSHLLRVKTPQALGDRFGLAPELLILFASKPVFARDIQTSEEEAYRSEGRLDPGLVVVVDPESDLGRRLDQMPRRHPTAQRVPWNPARESLESAFRPALRRVDLFDVRDAVRGTELIGREEDVHQLGFKVSQGAGVGVCGLRKVGKTSLVRAVTDQLGHERPLKERLATVAWVDVQGEWRRETEPLVGKLAERVAEAAGMEPPPVENPYASLERALTQAHRRTERRTLIVLDEFDLLFEGGPRNRPFPGIERLFGLLRSMSQGGVPLTLVLIGRDPELLGAPTIGGVTSPLLGWVSPYWVPPLDHQAADNLLTRLGKRMGLYVGPRTIAAGWDWTGGHPYLHRLWGSAASKCMPVSEAGSEILETDLGADAQEERYLEEQQVQDTVTEVITLLTKRYPDALDALVRLAATPASERFGLWSDLVRADSHVRRLEHFGLLRRSGTELRLPRLWEWAARRTGGRRAA